MDKFGQADEKSQFYSQGVTGEDVLKTKTVGLVELADFRKRRAAALEGREEREEQPRRSKTKKKSRKGPLSFDDDEEAGSAAEQSVKLAPSTTIAMAPKSMTKSAKSRETETRERLRREFLSIQEAVKASEFVLPFVFFDGANLPGGSCKMRKGDQIWVFLDRSRKVGAAQGAGQWDRSSNRKEWARINVDDLMLVRGEVIVPHHFDFYYFLMNKIVDRGGRPVFEYVATAEAVAEPQTSYDPLSSHSEYKQRATGLVSEEDRELEGYHDDPAYTKVVDRRWYERNKHIYPASVWQEYNPNKAFSSATRKDAEGNTMFFGR